MNRVEDKVYKLVNDYDGEIINLRRDFHKYAESGWTEFRTASKIAEYLKKLGLEIKIGEEIFDKNSMLGVPRYEQLKIHQTRAISQGAIKEYVHKMAMGYTGVVGVLDTKRNGPTVAFRFDIDANDGVEDHTIEHRPFKDGFCSINKNAMHACGHDGHAAIGLVLAKVIKQIESEICGKVIFIFQPAEEGVRGAYAMMKKGIVDGVDYLFCGHIGMTAKKTGQIVCNTDGFMATTKLDVTFKGHSSHAGASPENGKNALLSAASAALNLHTLCQHGKGAARINVGVLKAGTGRNVVPSSAELKLETRGDSNEINEYITKRAIEVIKGAAVMYDVDYKVSVAGKAAKGKSSGELSNLVKDKAIEIPEIKEVIPYAKLAGSEDATYLMNRVQQNGGKAVYLMFGTRRTADHHNNCFDFDEKVLSIAVKTYAFALAGICNKNERGIA